MLPATATHLRARLVWTCDCGQANVQWMRKNPRVTCAGRGKRSKMVWRLSDELPADAVKVRDAAALLELSDLAPK